MSPPPPPLFFAPPVLPPAPGETQSVVEPEAEPTEPVDAAEPVAPAEPAEPADVVQPVDVADPGVPSPDPFPPPDPDPGPVAVEPRGVSASMVASDFEEAPIAEGGTEAAGGGVLRLGTRRRFVTFSIGRSFLIGSDDDRDFAGYLPLLSPPLRLEQTIGLHPRSDDGSGFFFALAVQQSFRGIESPKSPNREFGFGPRVGTDIPVGNQAAIYLRPSIQLGYNLHTLFTTEYQYGYNYGSGSTGEPEPDRAHRMDVQMALAARILLADRVLLSFRPVDFQIVTDFDGYSLRWNVMGGVGLTF